MLRLLALGVVAVLLAGCGGGEDDDSTASSSAAAPATTMLATAPSTAAGSAPASEDDATGGAGEADATAAPDGTSAPATSAEAPTGGGQTLQGLLGLKDATIDTPDVALMGGADFATGVETRVPFIVLTKDGGEVVEPDGGTAEVYLAPDAQTPAMGPFTATVKSLEVPGARFEPGIPHSVWIADIPLPAAGPYFLVARYTVDGAERSANTGLNVQPKESTPAVGSAAPASETPTLESTGGDLAKLTTADPPDTSLLEYSVADSIAAKAPFVVTFSTPKFCQSRICGPTVDIVLDVQKRLAGTPLRFIHAEIYKDNDPAAGVSPWITEWGLPSEPWVFVVDADGVVTAKFEGGVTPDELEAAARAAL